MRIISWLFSAVIVAPLMGAQASIPLASCPQRVDPYLIPFVSSAFQFYKDSAKGRILRGIDASKFTNNCPSLRQLGDATSIAILKIYSLDELVESENANVYLTILRISFSDRSRVLEKSDQDPSVTSLVLDYLERKESTDPALEKRIAYMKRCTTDFTCSTNEDFDSVRGQ